MTILIREEQHYTLPKLDEIKLCLLVNQVFTRHATKNWNINMVN